MKALFKCPGCKSTDAMAVVGDAKTTVLSNMTPIKCLHCGAAMSLGNAVVTEQTADIAHNACIIYAGILSTGTVHDCEETAKLAVRDAVDIQTLAHRHSIGTKK